MGNILDLARDYFWIPAWWALVGAVFIAVLLRGKTLLWWCARRITRYPLHTLPRNAELMGVAGRFIVVGLLNIVTLMVYLPLLGDGMPWWQLLTLPLFLTATVYLPYSGMARLLAQLLQRAKASTSLPSADPVPRLLRGNIRRVYRELQDDFRSVWKETWGPLRALMLLHLAVYTVTFAILIGQLALVALRERRRP